MLCFCLGAVSGKYFGHDRERIAQFYSDEPVEPTVEEHVCQSRSHGDQAGVVIGRRGKRRTEGFDGLGKIISVYQRLQLPPFVQQKSEHMFNRRFVRQVGPSDEFPPQRYYAVQIIRLLVLAVQPVSQCVCQAVQDVRPQLVVYRSGVQRAAPGSDNREEIVIAGASRGLQLQQVSQICPGCGWIFHVGTPDKLISQGNHGLKITRLPAVGVKPAYQHVTQAHQEAGSLRVIIGRSIQRRTICLNPPGLLTSRLQPLREHEPLVRWIFHVGTPDELVRQGNHGLKITRLLPAVGVKPAYQHVTQAHQEAGSLRVIIGRSIQRRTICLNAPGLITSKLQQLREHEPLVRWIHQTRQRDNLSLQDDRAAQVTWPHTDTQPCNKRTG